MKICVTSLLLFLLCSQLGAQSTCVPSDARLEVNELGTVVNPLYLWWDGNNPQFNYPNGSPVNAVFAGGIWLTAQSPDGEPLGSVTTYGASTSRFDFQPGPTGTGGNFSSSTYFCRSFKVTRDQVIAHLADLSDGTLDQPIAEIMDWPGRNSASLPSTAMGRDLAPFVDANGDGIYQPEQGDYPEFRADEAIWWVTNDSGPHDESRNNPLDAEVQVLAQAFVASNHPASHAQLYTVTIANESNRTLDSLSLSLWVDPDLGCPTDDAVGSLPSRNAMYVYNIDATDGTNGATCEGGIFTYASSPPMVFFQTVSTKLDGTTPIVRNSGISTTNTSVGGPPQTGDASLPIEYFNLSHARWLDGSPITTGGDGYGGTIPTNWIYSGNPAEDNEWSQCQNYTNQDRRILLNVNLQEPFNSGSKLEVDFVVSVVPDIPLPCPDIDSVIPTLDSITDYVLNTSVSDTRSPRRSFRELSLKPNPARDIFSISVGKDVIFQAATLFDGLGRVVEQYSASTLSGSINVEHLARGVYTLVAEDAKGEQYLSRVVLE